MIVRGKSASGMVRWTVDADKPLLVLVQHARRSWPEQKIAAISRGSIKSDNVLTSSLGMDSFESAGVSNGEVFFVEFSTAATPAHKTEQPDTASRPPTDPVMSDNQARCFNYWVFAYLRKFSWFYPSENQPQHLKDMQEEEVLVS